MQLASRLILAKAPRLAYVLVQRRMESMAETTAQNGTIGDRLTDLALRGLIQGLRLIPYAKRVGLMGWVMRRLLGPMAGYRNRALTNLARIYPEMPAQKREEIADASLDNFGRTLIENYSGTELAARLHSTLPQGPGLAALQAAVAAGRPVIFVTAHIGNYEAPRHVLTRLGHSIGGIYRAMGNPWFNAHYVTTLEEVSGPVFERGRGTAGFVRHLRKGGLAAILFDVHDTNGTPLPFLGETAMTSTSAAELALRYKADVIPYFGIRRANGLDFDIHLEAPIPHGEPLEMMAAMTARLEAHIAATPGQWFWVHRRWKPQKARRKRVAEAQSG